MRRNIFYLIIFLSVLNFAKLFAQNSESNINIIPQPTNVIVGDGYFEINNSTKIICDKKNQDVANYLRSILQPSTGYNLPVVELNNKNVSDAIILMQEDVNSDLGNEGYQLTVSGKNILIKANADNGLFYGVQTLRQLLPAQIESSTGVENIAWKVPLVEINDKPKFVWRGLNLDCCRHFMSKDFIKRYIDLLAYHKFNILHWHLTEDQGWRLEIKKYPELTSKGAFRIYDDGSTYGGFYTQEDVKEIINYAASRFITVVPEIEMPGHSTAAVATYPNLSCTGGPFEVGTLWGIYKDIYCAGNDETFKFLEDVLSEVIELFPSKYIHIGGDEAPKDRWKNCPKCQQRIKNEGLSDEHELQSYFVKRIEKFINSKGKKIIGWDEILEGGLAPEATVQSWRGVKGAIEAAKQGHDVIVSPTSNCYFDYPVDVTDLQKVYSFDPIPAELTEQEKKHVLGSEGNMWSEYAPQELIDDRLFPRMLALSEVVWTYPKERNYEEFLQRVQKHYNRLDLLGVNYGLETKPFDITKNFNKEKNVFELNVNQLQNDLNFHLASNSAGNYNLLANLDNNITVSNSDELKFSFSRNNKNVGKIFRYGFTFNKATRKNVTITNPYNERYSAGGVQALTDGVRGSDSFRGGDNSWQGYLGDNFEAIVDLESLQDINKIACGFFQASSSAVVFPEYVEIFISGDGINFISVGKVENIFSLRNPDWMQKDFSLDVQNTKGRYIKIFAKNPETLPTWHPVFGGKTWLMVDEIIVE